MKKRIVLKKWVENLIYIISATAFIVIGSECDNNIVLLISHTIAGAVLLASVGILNKYGRDND